MCACCRPRWRLDLHRDGHVRVARVRLMARLRARQEPVPARLRTRPFQAEQGLVHRVWEQAAPRLPDVRRGQRWTPLHRRIPRLRHRLTEQPEGDRVAVPQVVRRVVLVAVPQGVLVARAAQQVMAAGEVLVARGPALPTFHR